MALRHFMGDNHPLFRTPKAGARGVYPYTDSIYYWWYEALRRSSRYQRACRNDGRGMAKLYAAFGNVVSNDFRSWWNQRVDGEQRGRYLFAEPISAEHVAELSPSDIAAWGGSWDREEQLVIAIPRQYTLRHVKRYVGEIVREANGLRRKRKSRALYPIARKFNIHAMRTAFSYWDLAKAEPKLKRWQLCNQLDKGRQLSEEDLRTDWVWRDKQSMNTIAVRYINLADKLIKGAEKGIFPG